MGHPTESFKDLSIAIVDDDPGAVRVLGEALADTFGIHSPATGRSADDALTIMRAARPDILFLDIELNEDSAIDILSKLAEASPDTAIVFYTVYQKYLINALRTHAFDFLLKPVDPEELSLILHRFIIYRQQLHDRECSLRQLSRDCMPAERKALSITTVTNDRIIVGIRDIVYFKYHSERKLWEVVLNDFRHHILRRQTTAEAILSRHPEFVRTHKSFIVNISYISMITSGKCVLLPPFDASADIKISKNYRKDLLDKFYDI